MTAMITVTGNVGRIDVREISDGNKVVNFGVASNQKRKDKETTTWVNCVAFNQLAGMLEQHLRQGAKVLVIGDMKNRSWEKDGVTNYRTECVVNQFEFLSPKSESQDSSGFGDDDFNDDAVPF
tara:strand:+ start:8 stop:376 length:369 start_codon:yes stop_codon:yes gene_type:complete